jgi:hypothetical protein
MTTHERDDAILAAALAKIDCQKYALTHHHPAFKYFMDLHDRLDVDGSQEVAELVPGPVIDLGFLPYKSRNEKSRA